MEDDELRPPLSGLIILFIGAAFITVGAGFLTYGIYAWVRTGIWPHYPASKMLSEVGLPYPQLGWNGGQGALDWVLASSACVVLLTIGALVTALGAWRVSRFYRRRRLAEADAEAATA
ncbi:MAG TPA: hypothetical protein VMG08_19125 [Allosphingosinicella sp.]|nr:hypothetical protein [Allosphingosinicella sp.]